jgi:hypothetical protein
MMQQGLASSSSSSTRRQHMLLLHLMHLRWLHMLLLLRLVTC